MVVYQSIFLEAENEIFSFSLYLWCIYCDYRSIFMSDIKIYPIFVVRVEAMIKYVSEYIYGGLSEYIYGGSECHFLYICGVFIVFSIFVVYLL